MIMTDADPRLVHHVEHDRETLPDLADEVSDSSGPPARRVAALPEREQRVRRAAVAHLVVEADERDIVALAAPAVRAILADEHARHDEQRDPLGPGRGIRRARQHEMHDVLGQLVIARRDPHLGAPHPVRSVGLWRRERGDVAERRPGLRLRERHRAEPAPLDHRHRPGRDLLGSSVLDDEVRVGRREERIRGGSDRPRLQEHRARRVDDPRQLPSAELLVEGAGGESRVVERPQRLRQLGGLDDGAIGIHDRLVLVEQPVDRREHLDGQRLGDLEQRVEGVAVVVPVAFALRQRLDVEPLVEQEVEVTAGQQSIRGHGFSITPLHHPAASPC
jgi:hypothetical protein